MFVARVPVQVVSSRARVELDRAVWAVETTVAGKLAKNRLELGLAVEKGETLALLDLTDREVDLTGLRARLAGTSAQLDALGAEVAAQQQALADANQSEASAIREAAARRDAVELAAAFARREFNMTAELAPDGLVSKLTVLKAETAKLRAEAIVASFPATAERESNERAARRSERLAILARLQREKQALIGQIEMTKAEIAELERKFAQRVLKAPATGVIAEVTPLARRSFLEKGTRLGVVVAPATLMVVGEFAPAAALGHVAIGQHATMRLDGFAWSQYGELDLEVVRVAGETQVGHLRVEFRVAADPPPGIDLQHGLAGTCFIDIEQASPAELLLRAAGASREQSKPQSVNE